MDTESIQAIASLAEKITTIGVLLIWIYAERKDNRELWSVIERLTQLRLRQIEDNGESTQPELPIKAWRNSSDMVKKD